VILVADNLKLEWFQDPTNIDDFGFPVGERKDWSDEDWQAEAKKELEQAVAV
jgi:hypothetical protein